MKYKIHSFFAPATIIAMILASPPANAQQCPGGALATPKSSALYIYFPTAVDSTFPSYGGVPTSPLNPFDMASHDASISTAAVRQRVLELMQTALCEFDVNVKLTTAKPVPPEARWQIVGLGSDSSGGTLVGRAQAVDTNDAVAQDFCRVWVNNIGTFSGPELTGANSTLERWATAITNLTAHESGHNYGGTHGDSAPRPGEDGAPNHFMADPAAGATPDSICDRLNHHSDATYERFGHDIGLNTETLHNWDFTNPNSSSANSLTIRILSSAPSLSITWFYTGSTSPWTSPTVTKMPGKLSFQGTAYNIFDLVFSAPKSWSGGPDGVVPAGVKFHVGASFAESPVIINETTLKSGSTTLALKPRMFGYDAGTSSFGDFAVNFYNTGTDALVLSDLQVFFLPRMLDLNQMIEGGALLGIRGEPILPFQRQPGRQHGDDNDGIRNRLVERVTIGKDPFVFPVARLTDRRHLDFIIPEGFCEPATGPGFGDPRVIYCPTAGNVLSLFPATYTYVTATVTDPNAHYWDPAAGAFVDGPLSSRLFFQVAGFVPDANRNGKDDLIDVRNGTSKDANNNGIPDEAEDGGAHKPRLAFFARLGAAFPQGSVSGQLDPGLSGAIGLEYEVTNHFSALGTLGLDKLSDDGLGSDVDIHSLSADGRFYFVSGGSLQPFLQGGAGIYNVNPGDTDWGAHAGAGLRWNLSQRTALEAMYQRHRVYGSGGGHLEFSNAQIGLRWKFGL